MTPRGAAVADRSTLAAAQERSRAIGRTWREGDGVRAALDRFAGIDSSATEAVADAAAAMLADADWVAALLHPLVAALAADPWFEPPFRVHRDALRTGAVLLEVPAVSITASVTSADTLASAPPPATVVTSGRLSLVRYHRAGGATLRRWRAPPVGARFSAANAPPAVTLPPVILDDGAVVRHDGRVEAHLLERPARDVAAITVSLRAGAAPLMREYRVADGALVRTAATEDTGSRTQMLLTLLRLSGRDDAAEAFDTASRAPAFELRWAAMREWLALDVMAALPRLRAMADDPHPEVRAAARATLPRAEEAAACPA